MPGAVTVANVSVDSCPGETVMFEPPCVLKSVNIARTISESTSVISGSVAVASHPPFGSCCVR